LDDLKVEQKLAILHNHYPPEEFESYLDLLLQIINRNYNRINRYTKALALYRISKMKDARVSPDIIANLFNPDNFLLQTAAYVIYCLDKDAYHLNTKRLKSSIKKELDKAILPPVFKEEDEDFHQKLLLIERVLFLKKVPKLSKINGDLICLMAELLDEIRIEEGTIIFEEGTPTDLPLYVIIDGAVDLYLNDKLIETRKQGDLVGEMIILNSDISEYTALVRNQCTFLVLQKTDLFDLMSKHVKIVEAFIDIYSGVEQNEERLEVSDILLNV
ncbi:MAG: AAA family ATP:ADP antiporter, partial [Cyclobacteriaceae bacterium]